ncbi:hypothetical protein RFI_31851 [Reticulomyxa filosa]|uniref:Uncharacterized protein n=1 Tax=Reticulomyxa filosa TaxID=46433 RepID=X6LWM7_RETFI|nr:hypothetical protein RFI_31851 [Reticulomyxa filosa]|eukprot:ETO05542.1 hypothetical protein RFI_31851 [Reticulomyxa filosa]
MHRRSPQKWNKEALSKKLGLSMETIDFIFWEDEMRRKYKIPYDLDTIKLLEAYCGTDDVLESRVILLLLLLFIIIIIICFTLSFLSIFISMCKCIQVTGDPYFTSGRLRSGSPLLLPTEELDEHLYSWQRKQQYKPNLRKDHYELIPQNGSGSGKIIDTYPRRLDAKSNYMIVDIGEDDIRQAHDEHMNVKIRESNGHIRWATVEECNFAHMKEYPKGFSPHDRIRSKRREQMRARRKFPKKPFIDTRFVEHHWW